MRCRATALSFAPLWRARCVRRVVCHCCLTVLSIALCLVAYQPALCQNLSPAHDSLALDGSSDPVSALPPAAATKSVETQADNKNRPESEVVVEGAGSFGHYHLLANSWWSDLYWSGIEYDRHSWGYFLKARMDYVAEVLPFVLLREPAKADIWGDPSTTAKKTVPGLGISPIGMRMMWFDKTAVKPYFMVKGGLIGFPEKVLSTKASYESLSLQLGIGMQVRMSERTDLRLGLFNDFHFSNAFIVPVNPGLDVMNASFGVSYHLANATPRERHRRHGLFRAAAARSQTP